MSQQTILLVPEKTDIEFDQLFNSWTQSGGAIRRLGKYWIKDEELTRQKIAIYGNQTFSLVLAQIYEATLLSPDDTLIARLDHQWVKRTIAQRTIGQLASSDFPAFVKPVIPKLFLAGIFEDISAFRKVTEGLSETEEVLISEIISDITAEARSFVKDGNICDIALYEGAADLETASIALKDFLVAHSSLLPGVVVVDLAYSPTKGWFILEFNACWGAGLNNCEAGKVLDCIVGATISKY